MKDKTGSFPFGGHLRGDQKNLHPLIRAWILQIQKALVLKIISSGHLKMNFPIEIRQNLGGYADK